MDTADNMNTLMNQAPCSSVHLILYSREKTRIMFEIEANLLWPFKFKIHSLNPEFLLKPV